MLSKLSRERSCERPPVWSPERGRSRSPPGEKAFRLSQDARYVFGSSSPVAEKPRSRPTSRRKNLFQGQFPQLPRSTIHGVKEYRRVRLEDLCVSEDRRQEELKRLSQWNLFAEQQQTPPPDTINKRALREESVMEIHAIPDLFDQPLAESDSTTCLNKRMFTAASLYDLKAIPDIGTSSKASSTNDVYDCHGRQDCYSAESLEDLEHLPSLSSYWNKCTTVKNISYDAKTALDHSDRLQTVHDANIEEEDSQRRNNKTAPTQKDTNANKSE